MKNFKKIITSLQNRLEWLGWWIWLKRRVNGRVKLRGNLRGLSIASTFHCDGDLWLGIYSHEGHIVIGSDVRASGPLVITAIRRVTLGAGVLIGPNVMITDHYHGDPKDEKIFDFSPSSRSLHTRGPIDIEDDVQIGANTAILSPSHIGRAAILGANSVANGVLESRKIYAGLPARPLKTKIILPQKNE